MNKQEIITFIEGQLHLGNISKGDLLNVVNNDTAIPQQASIILSDINKNTLVTQEDSSKNLINIFYNIGGIIVIIGVIILVAQHWDDIGFAGRILVTLGISFVTYVAGLLLNTPQQKTISQVMFMIAAALTPLGSYILVSQVNMNFDFVTQIYIAFAACIVFGFALMTSKKNILVPITIGFFTWGYYAFILNILGSNYNGDFLKWATMLLGACYICIGYGYQSILQTTDEHDAEEKSDIQNMLYSFGTLAILFAGIFVGGFFDIIFIGVIFAAFYGSVYLKSQSMLVLAGIFLMAHIIKLTSQYFVNSIGWPMALIIIGFLVVGVGYMTYSLNKKFISQKNM